MIIDMNKMLSLFSGIFIVIDVENSEILQVISNGKIIANNKNFSYIRELIKFENVQVDENTIIDDIIFFITKNDINGFFTYPFSDKNDKLHYYQISKQVDENTGYVYIYFECIDQRLNIFNLSDPLTKVYQKSIIKQIITNELHANKTKKFYLIIIDIDDFKIFNDKYGHKIGDYVLSKVSEVFKDEFKNGYIGRIGGDEFLIQSFDSILEEDIIKKMNNLLSKVNCLVIKNDKEEVLDSKITITCGISRYPNDGNNYDKLFEKADNSLYLGKFNGKNSFHIYK